MAWVNADGLLVKFNKEGGRSSRGGAITTDGPVSIVEVDLIATDLTTTSTIYGSDGASSHGITIPKGGRIEKVEYIVTTAFAGTATGINVGLVGLDRTTVLSATGVTANVTTAALVAAANLSGATTSAPGGASMGATLATGQILTAQSIGGTFTAGRAKLRIHVSAV